MKTAVKGIGVLGDHSPPDGRLDENLFLGEYKYQKKGGW